MARGATGRCGAAVRRDGPRPAARCGAILLAVPALPLIAIFGPTGVGKTAVAIAVAERLRERGEDPVAVSADALQLYRGLEILTGAASHEEQARLEHRLLGILPLTARATAGDFARRAHAEIDRLIATDRRPIVVGGTGLYLRAALARLDLRPPGDPATRAIYAEQARTRGTTALHATLADRDREAAAAIAPTDTQRVVRALELLDQGDRPPAGAQLWTTETRHRTLLAALTMDRAALNARIDARVDAMVAAGVQAEVRAAAEQGASPAARQALGFEELLAGDVDAMKTRTHRYAKRQLTWLRKLPGTLEIDLTHATATDAAEQIVAALP